MIAYLLILLAFLADRLSKRWALAFLDAYGPQQINPWLTIRETYNEGIAFGMFQGIGPLVGWLTIVVVVGLLLYLMRIRHQERLLRGGLALLIGGALGNLVDRITTGSVLDFLETPLRPGIFNVADLLINLGIILILLSSLRPARKETENQLPLDVS